MLNQTELQLVYFSISFLMFYISISLIYLIFILFFDSVYYTEGSNMSEDTIF